MAGIGVGDAAALAFIGLLGVEAVDIVNAIKDKDASEAIPLQGPAAHALESLASTGASAIIDVALAESDVVGRHIFNTIIDDILDVRAGAVEADAANAILVLERVLGVSAQLPLLFAQIGGIAKLALGNRAESFENSAIAHLPEELGLNFFLAEILASLFRTAVGTPLEEAINIVHRPSRLDANLIKRLLQQHKIDEATARHFLTNAGYPDELQSIFLLADQTFLSVSEMQEAYLQGYFTEADIATHLQRVGYDDNSILTLTALIVQKSQTQGGDFLRSVARSLVERGEITQDQFTTILRQAHVPDASIILEVEALDLLLASKHTNLSVGQIKSAFQAGTLSQDTALLDLQTDGYSPEDAGTLIQTWIAEATPKAKSIGDNRILTYFLSGVLSREDAFNRLVAQGLKTTDANFLLDHPSATGTVYRYNLVPSTVYSAVKEGVLTSDDAQKFLVDLGVDPTEATLQLANIIAQVSRKKKPKGTTKSLTVADIKSAFDNELIAPSAVHRILVDFGYDTDDADLLFAIWQAQLTQAVPDGWVVLT